MDGYNGVPYPIASSKFEEDKRYREFIIQKVVAAICAMLNSNGGKVVIHFKTDNNNIAVENTQIPMVMRILEQSMISIIGLHQTTLNIDFQELPESVIIFVKEADFLITTNYNLYLPSQTQVVQVSSLEPLKNVEDIINRKVVPEPVQVGSHCQIFCKDTCTDIRESKTVQLKYLEAQATNRTTLADRVIGKANKFTSYVSAFGNFNGGNIYYGIRDSRVVVGELIPSEEDMRKIAKKVEKAIKKMIWPEQIGQPKKGEHWDIFFEPVLDKNAKPIPSTFVIVIYIAACLGGVFTEGPECYEMVERHVKKMSFKTWKRRLLPQSTESCYVDNSPSRCKRVTWTSSRIKNVCVFADYLLTQCVNNGQSIAPISDNLEKTFPCYKVELKLLVLSKRVMARFRSSCFNGAKDLLDEYSSLLPATTEFEFFDAIRMLLLAAMLRAQGNLKALSDKLPLALQKAEKIEPGPISAAIYLVCVTVIDLFPANDERVRDIRARCSAILPIRALEHVRDAHDSPIVQTDMQQKTHMTIALRCLGCDMYGKLTSKVIDNKSLNDANSSLKIVEKSIDEGNELNVYRGIGSTIVNAIRVYRLSQVQPGSKALLREGFGLCEKAECLASEYKFREMVNWARACKALFTEGLVRTNFKAQLRRRSDMP